MPLFGVRVLVVDDDEDTVELEHVVLTMARAEVRGVRSVSEALAALMDFHPDVVITDLAMPGEDGFALLDSLHLRGEHPATLVLTAMVEPAVVERAKDAGFGTFLAKPIEPESFVRTVAQTITRRS